MNATTKTMAMGAPNLNNRRRNMAAHTEESKILDKMRASKSFHDKPASKSFHAQGTGSSSPSKRGKKAPTKKHSKSFHCRREREAAPSDRHCPVHPEIALPEDEEACPKCALRLMKIAAKSLERRASELEIERKEMVADEKAKRVKRRERKLVPSSSIKASSSGKGNKSSSDKDKVEDEGGESRDQEIKEMFRWSTGFEYTSSQRSNNDNRTKDSLGRSRLTTGKDGRPRLVRQFSIGQVAQPSDMDKPLSRKDTLIKIARLREGDGVWVRRSDDMWTYATLKSRESGPDANLVFTVSGRGGTKKFPVTHWHKFVRIVAENNSCTEEVGQEDDEIDMMLSSAKLFGDDDPSPHIKGRNCSRVNGHVFEESLDTFASAHKTEHRGNCSRVNGHVFEESLDTFASAHKTYTAYSYDEESSSDEDEPAIVLQDHEVSMYNFSGQGNDTCLQDHEVSMFTLESVEESPSDEESSSDEDEPVIVLKDHEVSMYNLSGQGKDTCLQDHEVSMFTLEDDDQELQDHEMSMYTLGIQDESIPPILKYANASEDDYPRQKVSFVIPEDEEAGESSKNSSMTSIGSDRSLVVDYDADAEEVQYGEVHQKSEPALLDASDRVDEILRRRSSLPTKMASARNLGRPKMRAPIENRVSEPDYIQAVNSCRNLLKKATSKKITDRSDIAKKKLTELDMGKALPRRPGHARQASFHSALKSIHRRESIMMPLTT